MNDDTRIPARAARGSKARRPRSGPSAGLPVDELSPEERMAELDTRLARLEAGARYRERGRQLLGKIMPPDASRHFRNAGREELLGIRSIVDFWIARIDDAEDRAGSGAGRPERIDVG